MTQEDIDCIMSKVIAWFLLPVLEHVLGPWTFTRAHVNDFTIMGNVGSWEGHDWLDWTPTIKMTQIAPASFVIECDIDLPSDDDQYFVIR